MHAHFALDVDVDVDVPLWLGLLLTGCVLRSARVPLRSVRLAKASLRWRDSISPPAGRRIIVILADDARALLFQRQATATTRGRAVAFASQQLVACT